MQFIQIYKPDTQEYKTLNDFANTLTQKLTQEKAQTKVFVCDVWFDFDLQIMWTTIIADDGDYTWQLLSPTEQKHIITNSPDKKNILTNKLNQIKKHDELKKIIDAP